MMKNEINGSKLLPAASDRSVWCGQETSHRSHSCGRWQRCKFVSFSLRMRISFVNQSKGRVPRVMYTHSWIRIRWRDGVLENVDAPGHHFRY